MHSVDITPSPNDADSARTERDASRLVGAPGTPAVGPLWAEPKAIAFAQPLALASGAGSGAQNAVGTGVIGGMLASTFLAIFFVPLFFVLVLRWFRVRPKPAA